MSENPEKSVVESAEPTQLTQEELMKKSAESFKALIVKLEPLLKEHKDSQLILVSNTGGNVAPNIWFNGHVYDAAVAMNAVATLLKKDLTNMLNKDFSVTAEEPKKEN